jgi:hypothetical protein
MQFAEGRNVIDAGVGAGVGEHHETVTHQDATAICHDDAALFSGGPTLYTDVGGQAAIFPKFWICCAAWSTRTLTEITSPAPP